MLLSRLMKKIGRREEPMMAPPEAIEDSVPSAPEVDTRPRVLNVGGNSKQIPIPDHYRGWNHLLLDIAPGPEVDVLLDARKLSDYHGDKFDSVYSSHNLEHFYPYDVPKVLSGFMQVLKPGGFVDVRVPDLNSVLQAVVERGMELDDVLYVSPAGPISAHDVIYGWGAEIERSGVDFFAHKRGFSAKSLSLALEKAGFVQVRTEVSNFEVRALAFKTDPAATPA